MLQRLTVAGWPAVENQKVQGWLVRFSSGLTRRANSVLPWGEPTDPAGFESAVREVEYRSAERWLAPTFQLWSGPASASGQIPDDGQEPEQVRHHRDLDTFLTDRGYTTVVPTDVLWLDAADLPDNLEWDRQIIESERPDDAWMAALHQGLNRDLDAATDLVLRRLVGTVRSRFYRLHDDAGQVIAVSKMSIVPDPSEGSTAEFGGIYSMWVHPDHRRRGLARRLLRGTFHQARQLGLQGLWLQVEHSARLAHELYIQEGFRDAASYRYLTRGTSTVA